MSKRPRIRYETEKTQVDDAGTLAHHRGGKPTVSSLIRFKDRVERNSFYQARQKCTEQTKSTNGVEEFMLTDKRTFQEGESSLEYFELPLVGFSRTTLNDIPEIFTEEEFLRHAQKESEAIVAPWTHEFDMKTQEIAKHLFTLSVANHDDQLLGKMMHLLSELCCRSIHCEHFMALENEGRKKISKKISAIDMLDKEGLITGSIWSHSAFWNSVKAQLLLKYDLTSEQSPFSPFHPTFKLLKYFFEIKQHKALLLDSILYMFKELSVFNKLSGYKAITDDKYKRRSISDSFRNLPKHESEPGFDIISHHV